VDASSNRTCATCPTVAMVRDIIVPIADVGASSNHACATCHTVATGEAHPLLLGHHSSDGTAAAGYLPVATEGYRPLLHRYIVVVSCSSQTTGDMGSHAMDELLHHDCRTARSSSTP
jgi:hypothetical protein